MSECADILCAHQIVISGGDEHERKYAKRILPTRRKGNWLLCTLLLGAAQPQIISPGFLQSTVLSFSVKLVVFVPSFSAHATVFVSTLSLSHTASRLNGFYSEQP